MLAEPHYGVPGMVLLPRSQARAIFEAERARLGTDQAYEVFDWFLGEEYVALVRSVGLDAELSWTRAAARGQLDVRALYAKYHAFLLRLLVRRSTVTP